MSIESRVSGHWTDDELIAHIYGISPKDEHFETCRDCQARVLSMRANRQLVESSDSSNQISSTQVSSEFLAAQRRKIYSQIDKRGSLWLDFSPKHWASAATTLLLIVGGLLMLEDHSVQHTTTVSDSQLSQEISQMAQDDEPQPTAPLEALFQE